MALRYAVANGNWSNTATWDGGTLPTVGDDVHANGFTVTINQNITVNKISTKAESPAAAGGQFTCNAARTITANIEAGATTCLTNSATGITITVIGNIYGGETINARGFSLNCASNNTVTNAVIVGNLYAGSASGANALHHLAVAGTAQNMTAQIVGNIFASTTAEGFFSNLQVVNQFTLIGNATASTFAAIGQVASLDITGIITSSSTTRAVTQLSDASTLTISGKIINVGSVLAFNHRNLVIKQGGSLEIELKESVTNDNIVLRTPLVDGNYPNQFNVRSGVIFGSVNEYIGTLDVPPSGSVALGVPVDDGVGTAMISITDMGALLASYIV
jgi:hypothetical protein